MLMKKNRFIIIAAVAFGMAAMTACGGGASKGEAAEAEGEQTEESADTQQTESAAEQPEQKAEAKKWYEQDFMLTYKQYVMGKSITHTYARKGNIVVSQSEGSPAQNMFVFTDSTRTDYLVNPDKGRFGKIKEKTGFSTINEGIKSYLKSQMGDNVFGKMPKLDDEDCTVKDTTIFGRPAYVITQEKTQKVMTNEVYTKVIVWLDKENGLPYYKYGLGKNNGQVVTDGKVMEISAFSAEPTYEGLIMSFVDLTDVSN